MKILVIGLPELVIRVKKIVSTDIFQLLDDDIIVVENIAATHAIITKYQPRILVIHTYETDGSDKERFLEITPEMNYNILGDRCKAIVN